MHTCYVIHYVDINNKGTHIIFYHDLIYICIVCQLFISLHLFHSDSLYYWRHLDSILTIDALSPVQFS